MTFNGDSTHDVDLLDVQTAVLALAAIVPMLISRDLSVVARYSRNSIIMMLFLSSTMILLAVVAVVERKQAPSISFLPPLHGEGILSASWKLLVSSLSVLAVGFLAFTCQVSKDKT